MMSRWFFALRNPSNRLWLTPAYSAVLAGAFAFAAHWADLWLPPAVLPLVSPDLLDDLLNIIASSMLAVSTFSLSILVSALSSAANAATPRATGLVTNDGASRRTIASFISALIYAIIAKTALGLELYAQNGRFLLFVSTIAILLYVVLRLIGWIYTLSQLGRMGNTLDKIYQSAEKALLEYRKSPQMGACWAGCDSDGIPLKAGSTGYLVHINMQSLQNLAEQFDGFFRIRVRTGELMMPDTVMAEVFGTDEETCGAAFRQAFIIDHQRTFNQDPRWGLIVFSEAAQRALSPAVNDPGTAIAVISKLMKLLIECPECSDTAEFDRLAAKPLDCRDFLHDSFYPIVRDGGSILEVHTTLQKALACIWRNAPESELQQAALETANEYLLRAKRKLEFEQDFQRVKQLHSVLFAESGKKC